jgi:hypothetical protein
MICNPLLKDCTSSSNPEGYVNNAFQAIISIFFIVAVIYFFWHIIFAGLHIIGSDGDPKKLEQGKNEILNAFVGLIAIFSIFAIIKLVGTILGIQGLENLTITWPTL